MSITGVECDASCLEQFKDLKTQKGDAQALEFKIDGNKIIRSNTFPKGCTYADFVAGIPKNEARYYVLDFKFEAEGVEKSKLFFITWNPDSGKVKTKMVYSGSKDALKAKLGDGLIEVQANDVDDLEEKVILARAIKGH